MGTDANALEVPTSTFGQATSIAAFFANDPIDGILGLAFQSISEDDVPPILVNAYSEGKLDKPLFTVRCPLEMSLERCLVKVYLQEKGNSANGGIGGVYTYGAIDTTNCGPVIAYQPLSSATYYQFEVTKFALSSFSQSGSW